MKALRKLTYPVLAAAGFVLAGQTEAALVLVIDVSNPAAVTITSTSANSQTNSSLNIGSDGITIQNFFTSAANYASSTAVVGNLAPTGSGFTYAQLGTFNFEANNGNFTAGNDLSIYATGATTAGSQVFSTSTRAFNGVAIVDFSSTPGALPTAGTTGNVYSGYFQSGTTGHGLLIGTFQVVPEPSPLLICALGLTVACGKRRR
ncbi:hypothetical protein KBB96_05470 [Luteolibacter ambystomatis]|uniref:PEP-CTERM sorting domain-containing protein n=1 Tax=Luteolibacter ambystomatis TaxID=2824561 RepID=A0A975J1P0_9BACT|nr:hypothetical protein [Luteolibacter ambystomatis]QUE52339.1 hypothetical protein KBB96_05470 [Luteolibacter ambystomatis]